MKRGIYTEAFELLVPVVIRTAPWHVAEHSRMNEEKAQG